MGRPVGPGWRLTWEALGLHMDWEPLPPPNPEPPAELVPAMIKEARAKDMRTCPEEKRALTTPPGGRRTPPSYGTCATCGWAHALPAVQEAFHE